MTSKRPPAIGVQKEKKNKTKQNRANLHLSPAQNCWLRMHRETKRCRIFLAQEVFKSSYPASVATQHSHPALMPSDSLSASSTHPGFSLTLLTFVLTIFWMATMNNTAICHHPVTPHLCPSNINQGKFGQRGWCQVKLGHPNWFCATEKSTEDSSGVSRYSLYPNIEMLVVRADVGP